VETMETYNIAEGWRAVRHRNQRAGLDELALEIEGAPGDWREVWRMEIPPKMPEEDLVSQAAMLCSLYDSAYERGLDFARRAIGVALDNLDLLGGEAV